MAESDATTVLLLAVTALKLLLMPAYYSTDFEVHRNWLAITHSLPMSEWYLFDGSPWTLDYPPLFAFFEFVLSHVAVWVDPLIVRLDNFNYAAPACVVFQRLSVIACDVLLYSALLRLCHVLHATRAASPALRFTAVALVCCNPCLIIVDNIHFQYNGLVLAVQIFSLAALYEARLVLSGALFCATVLLKHTHLVAAPFYLAYMLCVCARRFALGGIAPAVRLFASLAASVVACFSLAFAPFVYSGQIAVVLSRLFPFSRGLTHAYWAPNVWALYNFLDRVLFAVGTRILGAEALHSPSHFSSGLVGTWTHAVLPNITPTYTLLFTLLSMVPVLWCVCRLHPKGTLLTLCLCHLNAFLFAWHVHEKAIIPSVVLLNLHALIHRSHMNIVIVFNSIAIFSLFPLLTRIEESFVKFFLLAVFMLLVLVVVSFTLRTAPERALLVLNRVEAAYLSAMIPVGVLFFLQPVCLPALPFLPLLTTSVYCACGVVYCWAALLHTLVWPRHPFHV